jgi:hypothetical protein
LVTTLGGGASEPGVMTQISISFASYLASLTMALNVNICFDQENMRHAIYLILLDSYLSLKYLLMRFLAKFMREPTTKTLPASCLSMKRGVSWYAAKHKLHVLEVKELSFWLAKKVQRA